MPTDMNNVASFRQCNAYSVIFPSFIKNTKSRTHDKFLKTSQILVLGQRANSPASKVNKPPLHRPFSPAMLLQSPYYHTHP
jgi:hypothetical protein